MTIRDAVADIVGRGTTRRGVARLAAGTMLGGAVVAGANLAPARAQDATPAGDDTCPTTTEAENIALVERYTTGIWTADGGEDVADYYTEDTIHNWGLGGPTTGPDDFLERQSIFYDAFPDFALSVDLALADGDLVVTRYTATGTHEGALLEIEPTGAAIEYTGIQIYRIACGRIAETWGEADHLSLLRQVGAMPVETPPEE